MTKKHDIIWLDEIDSTNDEAAKRILQLDNLSVLSARNQIRGRGQRQHIWLSEPGKNLTFSIILKYRQPDSNVSDECFPQFSAIEQHVISDITTASVLKFLARHGIAGRIKLPNDILVEDRKICGILIEHSVKGMHLVHSIVGIGLNVNQIHFEESISDATSMLLSLADEEVPVPAELDLHACLEDFMEIFSSLCYIHMH